MRGTPRCSSCGNTGHMRSTCDGGEKRVAYSASSAPLDAAVFDKVKSMQDAGDLSKHVAETLRSNLREVNTAFCSSNYQHYLQTRRKMV